MSTSASSASSPTPPHPGTSTSATSTTSTTTPTTTPPTPIASTTPASTTPTSTSTPTTALPAPLWHAGPTPTQPTVSAQQLHELDLALSYEQHFYAQHLASIRRQMSSNRRDLARLKAECDKDPRPASRRSARRRRAAFDRLMRGNAGVQRGMEMLEKRTEGFTCAPDKFMRRAEMSLPSP